MRYTRPIPSSIVRGVLVLGLLVGIACTSQSGDETRAATGTESAQRDTGAPAGLADSLSSRYIDGGDSMRFVEHPENLPIGFPLSAKAVSVRNPFEGDKRAIALGGQLFVAYNCIDCHGAEGSGAIGPSFQDGRWHFGGSAAAVFESIYQGRPDGMPAWGGRISNDQIWMLTAYLRSLPAKDLTTENFTGTTVERTGH
jgi:mono/diheme cytochrome c family protein